jgi:hypothetical protein
LLLLLLLLPSPGRAITLRGWKWEEPKRTRGQSSPTEIRIYATALIAIPLVIRHTIAARLTMINRPALKTKNLNQHAAILDIFLCAVVLTRVSSTNQDPGPLLLAAILSVVVER